MEVITEVLEVPVITKKRKRRVDVAEQMVPEIPPVCYSYRRGEFHRAWKKHKHLQIDTWAIDIGIRRKRDPQAGRPIRGRKTHYNADRLHTACLGCWGLRRRSRGYQSTIFCRASQHLLAGAGAPSRPCGIIPVGMNYPGSRHFPLWAPH
jgi:hypothetical protein